MEKYKENINCENAIVEVEQTNNRIREGWRKRFYERFGGEGTIAKTDENCILIAFTKGEVIDFIDELLKSQKEEDKLDHDPKDGWCCACEKDIAVLEEKLKSQKESGADEVKDRMGEDWEIELWRHLNIKGDDPLLEQKDALVKLVIPFIRQLIDKMEEVVKKEIEITVNKVKDETEDRVKREIVENGEVEKHRLLKEHICRFNDYPQECECYKKGQDDIIKTITDK